MLVYITRSNYNIILLIAQVFLIIILGNNINFDHVINTDADNSVNIQIVSENFKRDRVEVLLEWKQENHTFHSYNISITPHVASTLISERMRVQLKVSYDILYNVSVLATPHCTGQGNNYLAALIELYYGEYKISTEIAIVIYNLTIICPFNSCPSYLPTS